MYARNGNPNQHWLEEKIAALHNADDAIVLASGVAALHALFWTLLESGDRVVYPNVSYMAVYRIFHELFNRKFKVETVMVDMTDLDAVKKALISGTFPLRMERINQSAQKIAEWLEERENITFVSYPGLSSHPGHETAVKQMKNGYGGVISFGLNADDKTVEHFCAALKVVTFAVSLGHDEILIFPQPSYDERIHLYPERFRNGFIRFSVGLEAPDDIIQDLDQVLKSVNL